MNREFINKNEVKTKVIMIYIYSVLFKYTSLNL